MSRPPRIHSPPRTTSTGLPLALDPRGGAPVERRFFGGQPADPQARARARRAAVQLPSRRPANDQRAVAPTGAAAWAWRSRRASASRPDRHSGLLPLNDNSGVFSDLGVYVRSGRYYRWRWTPSFVPGARRSPSSNGPRRRKSRRNADDFFIHRNTAWWIGRAWSTLRNAQFRGAPRAYSTWDDAFLIHQNTARWIGGA